jgi:hypothetical protein
LTSYLWHPGFITSDPLSKKKFLFYLVSPIVFSFRTHAFLYFGAICRFSWNGTHVSHLRFHDNRNMNTSADVSKFLILPVHFKCWILLKPVLGGVDDSLHLTVPFVNRLNQTKPATLSILQCWAFFRDSYFSLFHAIWFNVHPYLKELQSIYFLSSLLTSGFSILKGITTVKGLFKMCRQWFLVVLKVQVKVQV